MSWVIAVCLWSSLVAQEDEGVELPADTFNQEALPTPTPETPAPSPNPSAQPSEPVTNSGEAFKDPFSEPASPESSAPNPVQGPAGASPRFQTEPAPVPPQEPSPFGGVEPTPAPSATPLPEPDLAPPLTAPSNDSFQFPGGEPSVGPVSQEVVDREISESGTSQRAWSLTAGGGGALNVNRRHTQVHFESKLGYRYWDHGELGLLTFFRARRDKLLGFILHIQGDYRFTQAPSLRMEWVYGGGLGWTLRAPHSSFTEGRFTARVDTGLRMYVYPWFAIEPTAGLDTFWFRVTSKGKASSLVKGGFASSQGIASLNVRFEF